MSLAFVKITDESNKTSSSQQKKCHMLTGSIARDTGVKRQLIVAIVENLPETYENVSVLMNITQVNNVAFYISCDLKNGQYYLWNSIPFKQASLLLVQCQF